MQLSGQSHRIIMALGLDKLLCILGVVLVIAAPFHFHLVPTDSNTTGGAGTSNGVVSSPITGLPNLAMPANLPNTACTPLNSPPKPGQPNSPTKPNSPTEPCWQVAIEAANNHHINPTYFVRQINQESGFNPNAVSRAGAVGIAQFLPATAAGMGINPKDPSQALDGAAKMMADSYQSYLGSNTSPQHQVEAYRLALAAYNCGGACVSQLLQRYGDAWEQYLPAETQNYIKSIMGG